MNNRGNKIGNYIAIVIILVCALIFIFYFLNTNNNDKKGKPIQNPTTTKKIDTNQNEEIETTTSQIIIDNSNNDDNEPVVKEEVSNFASSLNPIVSSLPLYGNYDITTYYHGVEFDFKCTNYDTVSNKCLEGSALMKENNSLYPLFTYTNENENYFTRGDDFYIYFTNDLVMLVNNNIGVYSGEARLFDRKGNTLGSVKNVITGYEANESIYKNLYPNIEEGRIYYYSCNNGSVNINSTLLNDLNKIQVEEVISGTCK